MRHLDWSDAAHWNGGRRDPCHLCGMPAFLLDDAGRPAHKTCVEGELAYILDQDVAAEP